MQPGSSHPRGRCSCRRRQGQLPTAALVDSYRLRCKPIGTCLSAISIVAVLAWTIHVSRAGHYLGEAVLGGHRAPPPRDQFAAPATRGGRSGEAAGGNRHRARRQHPSTARPPGHPRAGAGVLHIQGWALEDASWAEWAVPCPVRRGDTDGMVKQRKSTTAAMHQRVRERLPHLERIVDAADEYRRGTSELRVLAQIPR